MDEAIPPPIKIALANQSVNQLFEVLSQRTLVRFPKSSDSGWACSTSNGITEIWYSECNTPTEALAHELLHTDLKVGGYRQYSFHIAKAPYTHRVVINSLLTMLDNELQHQRMDRRFVELGFSLAHFYEDADVNAFKKVRREAEKIKGKVSIVEFLRLYITLLAPGGPQSDSERSQAKVFLLNRATPLVRQKIKAIEEVFVDWRSSETLDAGPFLKRILEIIELGCSYWVGSDENFPDSGFFVGEPFELRAAQAS